MPATSFPGNRLHWLPMAAAIAWIAALAIFPVQSDDLFFYLSAGGLIRAEGAIPSTDPFLFSLPHHPWQIKHEWLSFLFSSWAMSLGGLNGIIAMKAVVIIAGFLAVAACAGRRDLRALAPLLLAVAAYCSSLRMIERSSLATETLSAVLLLLLFLELRGRLAIWLLMAMVGPLFALWANTHPGFVTGYALVLAWACSRFAVRRNGRAALEALIVLGTAIAGTLLNPGGWQVILYPLKPLTDPGWAAYRAYNFEWMPTLAPGYLATWQVKAFCALCVGTLIELFWGWWRLIPDRRFLDLPILMFASAVALFFIYLGLSAVRFVGPSAMALTAAVLMIREDDERPGQSGRGRLAAAMVTAAILLAAGWVLRYGYTTPAGSRAFGGGLDERSVPRKAALLVDALRFEGNVFNQHEFGSYLTWVWEGRRRVFYHGFVDDLAFYRNDYLGVNESRADFDRVVSRYGITMFFLATMPGTDDRNGPLLYRILHADPAWRRIYQDETATLFVKDPGGVYRIKP